MKKLSHKRKVTKAPQIREPKEPDLLPGSASRLDAFVLKHIAEIQQLRERFAETEARHKTEIEELNAHYSSENQQIREGYEAELKRRTTEQAEMRGGYKAEQERLETEQQRLTTELAEMRERFLETNSLLHSKSIRLAKDERLVLALSERLRKELWSVRKLSRLLDDAEKAAARLRSSLRWKLANPLTAIKAKLSSDQASIGYGHLERIVAAYSEWRTAHPEIAQIEGEIWALRLAAATREAERGFDSTGNTGTGVPELPTPERLFHAQQKEIEL